VHKSYEIKRKKKLPQAFDRGGGYPSIVKFPEQPSGEGIILLATKLAEKVYLIFITHRLISARTHWTNTSRGTKLGSTRHPI